MNVWLATSPAVILVAGLAAFITVRRRQERTAMVAFVAGLRAVMPAASSLADALRLMGDAIEQVGQALAGVSTVGVRKDGVDGATREGESHE